MRGIRNLQCGELGTCNAGNWEPGIRGIFAKKIRPLDESTSLPYNMRPCPRKLREV